MTCQLRNCPSAFVSQGEMLPLDHAVWGVWATCQFPYGVLKTDVLSGHKTLTRKETKSFHTCCDGTFFVSIPFVEFKGLTETFFENCLSFFVSHLSLSTPVLSEVNPL